MSRRKQERGANPYLLASLMSNQDSTYSVGVTEAYLLYTVYSVRIASGVINKSWLLDEENNT